MASTERAVLAGGCFWGAQDLMRRQPGVISTRVGYSGGDVPNATYRNHGTHAEAVEIVFDPAQDQLPQDCSSSSSRSTIRRRKNRQGNDVGMSYRSAIFYTSDEQKRVAEDTIADVDASGLWPGKVVTEVAAVGPFWEAEPEHQDYLIKHPGGYTCHDRESRLDQEIVRNRRHDVLGSDGDGREAPRQDRAHRGVDECSCHTPPARHETTFRRSTRRPRLGSTWTKPERNDDVLAIHRKCLIVSLKRTRCHTKPNANVGTR